MLCERITSRKNPKILAARALCDKKERDKTGLFAVEGSKLCSELICEKISPTTVFYTERAEAKYPEVLSELKACADEFISVTDEVYEKLTDERHPEGIFAIARKPRIFTEIEAVDDGFLILDGIQNPSNLGTVIRTACALGINKVLLGNGCADPFGSKALRASMGTLFKVCLYTTESLCDEIKRMKSLGTGKIFGAALSENSVDIRKISFSKNDHIVIGNEGQGISEPILALCDVKVIIPMQQNTESLNAAAAAAILLWEKQKEVMP